MVKRPQQVDFEAYYDALFRRQMDEGVITAIDNLTGRDLYGQATLTGMARYLVNRPVQYALHGTQINYDVDCQKIMRDCLIDGFVMLRVVGPADVVIQNYVHEVMHERGDEGELTFVRIQYAVQPESEKQRQVKMYREDWIRMKYPGATFDIALVRIYNQVLKEKDFEVILEYTFPYWPFVEIQWIDRESIIDSVKKSIIRLDGAAVQVSSENTRHSGRKLFIVGMKRDDNKVDPRTAGDRINYLPENAEAYYVDVDTGGIMMMFEEEDRLVEWIHNTTGVVSIKQLAGLSGESRQIAETPLIQLAEEIRSRFEDGIAECVEISQGVFGLKNIYLGVESPDIHISFTFLRFIADREEHMKILDKAVIRGAVTQEEEVQELRRLLYLNQADLASLPAGSNEQSSSETTATQNTQTQENTEV